MTRIIPFRIFLAAGHVLARLGLVVSFGLWVRVVWPEPVWALLTKKSFMALGRMMLRALDFFGGCCRGVGVLVLCVHVLGC